MHSNLKPGDFLYRTKNFILHVGIFLGYNRVLHNLPGKGVHITSIAEFAGGKQITYRSISLPDGELNKERLQELLASTSEYSLLNNNCEHTAWYLTTGEVKSPQIANIGISAAMGGLFGAIFFGKKGAVLGTIAGGGLGLAVATDKSNHQHLRLN